MNQTLQPADIASASEADMADLDSAGTSDNQIMTCPAMVLDKMCRGGR